MGTRLHSARLQPAPSPAPARRRFCSTQHVALVVSAFSGWRGPGRHAAVARPARSAGTATSTWWECTCTSRARWHGCGLRSPRSTALVLIPTLHPMPGAGLASLAPACSTAASLACSEERLPAHEHAQASTSTHCSHRWSSRFDSIHRIEHGVHHSVRPLGRSMATAAAVSAGAAWVAWWVVTAASIA